MPANNSEAAFWLVDCNGNQRCGGRIGRMGCFVLLRAASSGIFLKTGALVAEKPSFFVIAKSFASTLTGRTIAGTFDSGFAVEVGTIPPGDCQESCALD